MTALAMLDLQQRLDKLSEAERRQASAYLLKIKHNSPAWKKAMGLRMRQMDAGKKIRLADLARKLGHA